MKMREIWLILLAAIFLTPVISLAEEAGGFTVLEQQRYKEIFRFPNGSGEGETGFFQPEPYSGGMEPRGISAYQVRDGIYYLLDNENKKVIVANEKGLIREYLLPRDSWYQDIAIDTEGILFIRRDGAADLEMDREGNISEAPVSSDTFRFDRGQILSTQPDAVLAIKGRTAGETSRVLYEEHCVLLDHDGKEIGWIRNPNERAKIAPTRAFQADGHRIYLLLQEEKNTILYECTLGREKETLLSQRIERELGIERAQQLLLRLQRERIGFYFFWNR